jgi:arginase
VALPGWTVLGAPLDSSGAGRGECRAPRALREAGLVERIAAGDGGDIATLITDQRRDPDTGIVGFGDLRSASLQLRDSVAGFLAEDKRPLVLGGDCTVLIGVFAALRSRGKPTGLWFVDGHPDFHDGQSSPTGEAADMDLAILTGSWPAGLADLGGEPPMLDPAQVELLGHRPDSVGLEAAQENARLPEALRRADASTILEMGPARVGEAARARLERDPGGAWLHLDLDVLDESSLQAVSYPQPGGLDWEQLAELAAPLCRSPALVGLSVADLNTDRDPDGAAARRAVDLLGELLA